MDALSDVVDLHGGSLLTEDLILRVPRLNRELERWRFTVELLRSGVSVDVVPGQTIIEAFKRRI